MLNGALHSSCVRDILLYYPNLLSDRKHYLPLLGKRQWKHERQCASNSYHSVRKNFMHICLQLCEADQE
ncbi:hypothetical protein DPMN_189432 [Dreissena polymorpha]|uniref:Uncharacterized protein n=1 Tax=Dreissena polymorpha TaxID=45954 RepID=A0A9D4I9H0_DREPO|nr:hypothetical protein DPMN_189432 [Dreissena polymorpha]